MPYWSHPRSIVYSQRCLNMYINMLLCIIMGHVLKCCHNHSSMCTEIYWEHLYTIPTDLTEGEQGSVNRALANMTIVWKTKLRPVSEMCNNTKGWEGHTAPTGNDGDILNVFVLPENVFCRSKCCQPNMSRKVLYLVHPRSTRVKFDTKIQALKGMRAWYLKKH